LQSRTYAEVINVLYERGKACRARRSDSRPSTRQIVIDLLTPLISFWSYGCPRAAYAGEKKERQACKKPLLKMRVIGPSRRYIEISPQGFRVVEENSKKEPGMFVEHICHAERNTELFSYPGVNFVAIPRESIGRTLLIFNRGNDCLGREPSGEDGMRYPLAVEWVGKSRCISC
jgi:hypothetical protein